MKKILTVIIITWLVLSFARIAYYMYIAIGNLEEWGNLSSNEKLVKSYGNVYKDYQLIGGKMQSTERAVLISSDAWEFYVLRYLLYPKRIVWIGDDSFSGNFSEYDYIIYRSPTDTINSNIEIIQINQ